MQVAPSRALWHQLEPVNAVAYFSAECREAPARAGLRGFWMGYFACRAAPMGAVGPGVVEATFAGFHPDRVRRAIPQAWSIATPGELLVLRADAAASALRRVLGDAAAEALADRVVPDARVAIESGVGAGRPLFCANRDVAWPQDPVAALWQAATTLREHRGDGHVALLAGAGLDGCEAHVLFAAGEDVAPSLYQESRGWSHEAWLAAADRLTSRGLLDGTGGLTAGGGQVRSDVERRTDELAAQPYDVLGDGAVRRLTDALQPAATRIASGGELFYPNPMGLPAAPG